MDSTLELLNYSPKLVISKEGEDDNGRLSSEQLGTEESGFQEDSQYSPSSSSSYPPPHAPFESWFISESDLLILFELLGEFYDEEFDRLSYPEKKSLKDKVRVSVPKSHEELLRLYPDEASFLGEASSSPMNPRRPMGPEERDNDLGRLLEEESTNNEGLLQEQHQTQHEHEHEEETKKHPEQREEDFAQSTHHPEEDEEDEEEERTPKDFSEWFEPLEELILFDILGIDYREAFEAMSNPERRELRRKVDNTEPKSKEEILAMLEEEEEEAQGQEEAVEEAKEEMEDDILPLEISPKKSIIQNKREKSRRLTQIAIHPEKCSPRKKDALVFKTPRRMQQASRPARFPEVSPSPKRRPPTTGIDLSKVVSPVAKYIHSSPAPPLIRNIKPSGDSKMPRFLELCAKENNHHALSPLKEENFVPLPEANYKSSCLVREEDKCQREEKAAIKSCFPSTESIQPKIVRHLGRIRVPKSLGLHNEPGITLKRNIRDSVLNAAPSNESMIDMSVHEVKTIQKLSDLRF
eukprot:TRINITY_DN1859_c0_g1_i1.p1 TRINITY_DN1859_c0_g1~~TRINITY_DN1859_c0_g1_i1.p1  ORF type:complete len:536 (+),score=215.92 TRINITY_DN1859_c0_g1_i1:43-1608(+)